MRLQLVTAATQSPLTISALRHHVRLDEDDTTHDERLIDASTNAVAMVEDYLQRPLLSSTWALRLNGFPYCEIELPLAPVQSVSSVTYVDSAGVTQSWATSSWNLDNFDRTGRAFIRPVYGQVFPTARDDYNVVTVNFVAGWSDPGAIPKAIIRALLLIVGHFFENTEAVSPVDLREIPMGAKHLLTPYLNSRF